MKLDPVLLEILVCPDCKGSLTVDYDNDELICNQCGLIYPVRNDIPIMLIEEARRPPPRPAGETDAPDSPSVDASAATEPVPDAGDERTG